MIEEGETRERALICFNFPFSRMRCVVYNYRCR
jgi:hypothetical protein